MTAFLSVMRKLNVNLFFRIQISLQLIAFPFTTSSKLKKTTWTGTELLSINTRLSKK